MINIYPRYLKFPKEVEFGRNSVIDYVEFNYFCKSTKNYRFLKKNFFKYVNIIGY